MTWLRRFTGLAGPSRQWRKPRRRIAIIMAASLVAVGLSSVNALPAQAAVSCQVDYTLRTVWSTGFTTDITLHNNGDPLTAWTLGFTWPGNQTITQAPWNAGTWSQTGNVVSISNASWNGSVASGGVVTGVGFNAAYSGTNTNPTNFTINGVACGGTPPTPTLVVTPTSVNVPEGGSSTYAVKLSSAPAANVTVASTAGTGDADISVGTGASLTFTPANFATAQTVTVNAAEDADSVNGSRTIGVTATGIAPVAVTATEVDNDTPPQSLVVTPTSVMVGEGSTATYSVRLASAPTANVTVTSTAGTGDADLTVSAGGSLTFTPANFATPQNVTLRAAEDADTTNGTRAFSVGATGLPSVTVNATEVDNDTATQALVVTPTAVSVPEGGTATYSVRLAIAPTANVTVTSTAGTGDTDLTVSAGGSLTFTPANFATPQTVTLRAAEDTDTTNGARSIAVASTGLTGVTVTATEADNDTGLPQTLVVTPTAVSVPEGATATYAVRLGVQPSANVTVTSTAGTGDADLTVSAGASLTFTSANWNVTQNVTLAAAEDTDATNGTRPITVASTGVTSVTVAASEVDNDGTTNTYVTEFMNQYNKIHAAGAGYFSPEGVPYHSVETLMIEAPDNGHETTSEAYSFYVWLEAEYGRVTGDWTRFNGAWQNLETFIIPTQQTLSYDPNKPATYAPEFAQPSQYPSPLDTGVTPGQDPLYQELLNTYGNAAMYGMHWLLDVDNVYGYGAKVVADPGCNDSTTRVVYINTYERGPQESVWETVAHPSCETFDFGGPNGFLPLFIQDSSYAEQWRYTDAPDADARAVEAAYWALTWATTQGAQAQVTATVAKAAKMGDYLRYSFYDKYFKQPGCASPSCAPGVGKNSSNYLLSWYYAWGGSKAAGANWSWRIGSSSDHSGYQNPLAAWALSTAGPAAIRPQSPTAAADWSISLTRQLDFATWLQSAEGGIAGGATNSENGNYGPRPTDLPQFYGMTYDFQPVYHDPPSNQWFGFQAWGMSRIAEYYNVTGDAKAKAILDKWVAWAIANTTLGAGGAYQIPSTLAWTGAPAASFSGTGTIGPNPNLHVSIVDFTNDVGVTAGLAQTLTNYAARAGGTAGLGLQAKNTAKGLLDRLLLHKDSIGISTPETKTDINRIDDVWTSSNQQGLFVPPAFTGTMPNGDVIASGKSFLDVRTFLKSDPAWPAVQSYLDGGPAPVFTYHRFWAQSDIALALADFGFLFPNG
jgi:hypothetical protein